jgi:hypothetical protein
MSIKVEAYKSFIDDVVEIKESVKSTWVGNGSYPDVSANKKRNEILASLSKEQRNEIAKIVQESNESGIHDLLALLNDKATIEYNGVKLAKEPFGTELHFDFVARSEGDAWPKN